MRRALPLLALLLAGCTAEQLQQASAAAQVAGTIAGAACRLIEKTSRDARFACAIVDGASDAIGNMSTEGRPAFELARGPVVFEVVVPADQAEDFARKNGGR